VGIGRIELGSELSDFLVESDDLVLVLGCFLLVLIGDLLAVLLQLCVLGFELGEFLLEVFELGLFYVDVILED
jgi:hypothetical protein